MIDPHTLIANALREHAVRASPLTAMFRSTVDGAPITLQDAIELFERKDPRVNGLLEDIFNVATRTVCFKPLTVLPMTKLRWAVTSVFGNDNLKAKEDGSLLDLWYKDKHVTVGYRDGYGYGVWTTAEEGYGSGPDHTFEEMTSAAVFVINTLWGTA